MLLHLPDEVGAIRGVAVRVDLSCEEVGVGGKQKGVGEESISSEDYLPPDDPREYGRAVSNKQFKLNFAQVLHTKQNALKDVEALLTEEDEKCG